jgi:hypothetical protein
MEQDREIQMEKAFLARVVPAGHETRSDVEGIAVILEIKFGEAGQRLNERVHEIGDWETLQKIMLELKQVKNLSEAEKLFDELALPTA